MPDFTPYASPYNRLALSTASARPTAVAIHDLTLEGDGEEMAGTKLSEPDRIAIAKRLAEIGIGRLAILGYSPMPSDNDIGCAEKIVALDLPVKLDAFVKTKEEIDIAKKIGLWGVDILVNVNDAKLLRGRTGADIINRCKTLTAHAMEQRLHTCLMGMDSTGTRPEFLKEVITALEPHYDEFTVADSMGTISPYGLSFLLKTGDELDEQTLESAPT